MLALPKLAAPAQRALASEGIADLKQLSKLTETEVSQLHGMGPNALAKLREALKRSGLAFKGGGIRSTWKQKKASPLSRTDKVDEYMAELKHPLKAEAEVIRKIIKGVNKDITEEIKWNAPSFRYRGEYLVTFNLRNEKHVRLVFHNPLIPQVINPLLEGDYKNRRMAYFVSMRDVKANKSLLDKALKDLIRLIGR